VWDEISAELAAALRISRALASSYLRDAEVMRERLPKVGECLAAGDINYAMFNVIATRTAMMPTRRRTRAQQRSQRITAERNQNRHQRLTRQRAFGYARASSDEPPF